MASAFKFCRDLRSDRFKKSTFGGAIIPTNNPGYWLAVNFDVQVSVVHFEQSNAIHFLCFLSSGPYNRGVLGARNCEGGSQTT